MRASKRPVRCGVVLALADDIDGAAPTSRLAISEKGRYGATYVEAADLGHSYVLEELSEHIPDEMNEFLLLRAGHSY
jgi:hypothetical protein